MSEFLLQLQKEHQQQLENLKNQHNQLAKQVEEIKSQMTAVEGAFMAKKQSLEQIEAMIKAHNATQATQVKSEEVSPPPPPAVEGELVLPDYKKPAKPKKKSASRTAVVATEAALPH